MKLSIQSREGLLSGFKKPFLIHILIFAICILTYQNCLHNDFLMDDYPRLLNNTDFIKKDFLKFNITDLKSQVYLRPVTDFFNFITFVFFGTNPLGYHVCNLLIFFFAAVSLHRLMNILFKNPPLALFTTLIFCTHPIFSVGINYKNATSFPFMILAVCSSILHYTQFLRERKSVMRLLFSLLWFVLAIFSHEIVVGFPLYLLAALYFSSKNERIKSFVATIPFAVLTLGYIALRSALLSSESSVLGYIKLFDVSFVEFLASYTKIISWFLAKLLTLHGIVLAWDTPIVREHLTEWLAGLGLFVIIATYGLLSKRITQVFKFGLAWLLIGLIPVGLACFSRPFLGFVIQPHWLFFSAIGFCVMIAELLLHLRRALAIAFLLILVITYGLTTRHYNELWSSEESYGLYWISVSEKNFWPNFWIGHYYLKNNQLDRAEYYYNQILGQRFMQNEVRGNLGIIGLRQGQLKKAQSHFETLLNLNYANAETHTYLGDIYLRQKEFKKSEYHLKAAMHFDSYLRTPKEVYIKLLEHNGRTAEAEAMKLEIKQLSNPQ